MARIKVAALLFAVCACLPGQDVLEAPRFPRAAYFRHFVETMPKVNLTPPRNLKDFMVGSGLELSLQSYLELVLANDTEIGIERLSIEPERDAITRASGPFDPVVATSFTTARSTMPSSNVLAGAATVSQLQQPLHFAYQQMLGDGTQLTVGFDGAKTSTNDSFATFNPALTASFTIGFAQPLLRNRGAYINRLPILVARARFQSRQSNLEDRLARLLESAEDAYWAAAEARETVTVQQKALDALDTSLKRYQKELDLGELAPVDMYQPQQAYSRRAIQVTEARFTLQQAEAKIRQQIGASFDPTFRDMPIVLTEALTSPSLGESPDREALVNAALANRLDLKAATELLAADDLTFEQARNALRPDVSLTGTYSTNGLGGLFIAQSNVFGDAEEASGIVRTVPGGLGDALSQVLRFRFSTFAFGLNLRIPIRDRRGAADLADALAGKRIDMLRYKSIQEQIRLEVSNACSKVESSRATIKLAQDSVDFARKHLEAEQKEYDRGVTTIFFLLDAQNMLTEAEGGLIRQWAQYRNNLANLYRVSDTAKANHRILTGQ